MKCIDWTATLGPVSVLCRLVSEKKKGTLKEKCNTVPPLMGITYRLVCIHYTLSISKIF